MKNFFVVYRKKLPIIVNLSLKRAEIRLGFSSCPAYQSETALCIYKTRIKKMAVKTGETPDFSGVSGECIYFGHSTWSVRPIKMFAKTLYLQGFAGQRRLFFLFFGWDLADFLPKGDFSVRPKKISAYSYFFSF